MNQESFYKFLDEKKETVTNEITALSEEGRTDEANI